MSAIGGIVGVVFGIFWMIMAFTITRDAPSALVKTIFPLFGVLFVIFGIMNVIFNARNATSKNRFSEFDITSHNEEPDPIDQRFGYDGNDTVDPDETVTARFNKVEELRGKGLISDEEYFETRERILNEI